MLITHHFRDKIFNFNPLSANPTRWSNTLKQFVSNLRTNYLSAFNHFVKLAFTGLKRSSKKMTLSLYNIETPIHHTCAVVNGIYDISPENKMTKFQVKKESHRNHAIHLPSPFQLFSVFFKSREAVSLLGPITWELIPPEMLRIDSHFES